MPTTESIARYWYWPSMKQDIQKWVLRCDACQRYKNFPSKKPGKLNPNEIPTKPWEIVTMDLLTDLPESEGYDAILVVVDRFSKMVRLIQTNKTMDSMALLKLCWNRVWKDFGVPRKIISDRGPQFASKLTREHNDLFEIETKLSTAYHPQTDGQSERMIQEVQKTLRPYMNHYQNNWCSQLAMVEFAMNNTIKSSTGYTPFYLVMGQHPNPGKMPRDLDNVAPTLEEFISGLTKAREIAYETLRKAAEQMKKFADRKRGPTPIYKVGDKVLLEASNFPSIRPTRKLGEKRYGPFKIIEKISDLNYRLELPPNWKIHPVFHVDQLRLYREDPEKPNFTEPPPELIEGEREFEVEKILDVKVKTERKKRKLYWLVQWKGYNPREATWEPIENLQNAFEMLDEYYEDNPKKPRIDYRAKKTTGRVQILQTGG
jgi:transposase InsO family protein